MSSGPGGTGGSGILERATRVLRPPLAVSRRTWWRAGVALAAVLAVLVALLPDPTRPAVVGAGVAGVAVAVAVLTGGRLAGTAALALVTVSVLLSRALDASGLRPVQVVVAGLLLLAMVTALDRTEKAAQLGVTVHRAAARSRLGPPALAAAAAVLVSVTAAQHVVPSVRLVLAGLAAAVTALVVAIRAHRN